MFAADYELLSFSTRGEAMVHSLEATLEQTRLEYGTSSSDANEIAKLLAWVKGLVLLDEQY